MGPVICEEKPSHNMASCRAPWEESLSAGVTWFRSQWLQLIAGIPHSSSQMVVLDYNTVISVWFEFNERRVMNEDISQHDLALQVIEVAKRCYLFIMRVDRNGFSLTYLNVTSLTYPPPTL